MIAKQTKHVQTLYRAPTYQLATVSSVRRFAPLATLSALALSSLAFAQEGTSTGSSLGAAATGGMGGVVAAVVAILLLGIGVKVLFFSNSGIKKGIGAAK